MTADLAEVGVEAGTEDGTPGLVLLGGSAAVPWLEHPAMTATASSAVPLMDTTGARTWVGVTSVSYMSREEPQVPKGRQMVTALSCG